MTPLHGSYPAIGLPETDGSTWIEFERLGGGQFNVWMRESPPDAVISLRPDPYAPRAARFFVGTVDRPSPDLRDVVVLLTSELVTRAVLLCPSDCDELVELRIWMPVEVVRVELRATRELLYAPPEPPLPQDGLLLLDDLADRWSVDLHGEQGCIWFEIDRRRAPRVEDHDHAGRVFASGPNRD